MHLSCQKLSSLLYKIKQTPYVIFHFPISYLPCHGRNKHMSFTWLAYTLHVNLDKVAVFSHDITFF